MKTEDIKNMARALQQVQEKKLTGNQHKLDMDKDGDIDAKDFAHMRKKKKSGKEEVTMTAKVDSEKGATEEQKEAKIDEISMDKATRTYAARKSQAQAAAHQGSMDYAKKQMAKARKTKAYMDKKESIEEDTMHVDIDHMGGHDPHAKKHNITLTPHNNAGNGHGHYAIGKKKDLQKYLAKHYDSHSDAKDIHPEVFKESVEEATMESTDWPIYKKIMEKRDMHTKGATEPEKIDSKDSPGGKKMRQDIAVDASSKQSNYDELGHDDASKAGRITKTSPARNGDNKAGDKTVVNPPEDITKKAGMKA